MKYRLFKSSLVCGLYGFISLNILLPTARSQTLAARLNLLVLEGNGATSGVRQRVARDPVVKVEDDDHRPVSGAAVVFALPLSGPSGEFINGERTLTIFSDREGLAAARGIKTNDIPGKLQIYVTASYRGLRARTMIEQVVEAAPGLRSKAPKLQPVNSGGRWKWVILGIAAAGGAGAGLYLARQTAAAPVSITAGTVIFGSPR